MAEKTIIGLVEPVKVNEKKFLARIDTGAYRSSIDKHVAKFLKLQPIKKVRVKSAHGSSLRPVIKIPIELANRRFRATFNIADRSELKYHILIGRNILKKGFLIDTSKK